MSIVIFLAGTVFGGTLGIAVMALLYTKMDDRTAHDLLYPECTGEPSACPENEGYGCGCSPARRP